METLTRGGVAGVSGTVTIAFRPDGSVPWRINQVSVAARTAPGGATCEIRRNGAFITPMVAQGDAADGTPIELSPFDQMDVVFAGLKNGDVAEVTVLYELKVA